MLDTTARIVATERRKIVAVFLWSLLCIAVLLVIFMQLVHMERRLENDIRLKEAELRSNRARVNGESLVERLNAEREKETYLLGEWKRYSNLLETWQAKEVSDEGDAGEAARIDFKVALFNARERLTNRAEEAGTTLPTDIGISENIETDENTAVRFLQLAAVQKLVGFALDIGIPEIFEIAALLPKPVPAADGEEEYIEQYPVRLGMRCSLNAFIQFLGQVMHAKHFFTVAHIHAEMSSKSNPHLLEITVILNPLVLRESTP